MILFVVFDHYLQFYQIVDITREWSNITKLVFILIQVHILFQFLLLSGNLLFGHVINQFIDIFIFNLFVSTLHHILCHLVHNLHSFLLCHELFNGFLIILITHFWICTLHYFCHSLHDVFHRLINAHLLQFKNHVLKLSVKFVILGNNLILFKKLLRDILFSSLNIK